MSASCQRDELRTLFLFESLSDDQLDRLCRDGAMATIEPGPIFAEGEPATCLYVLLEGEIALSKRSGGADIETLRSSQRGAYLGAWSAFLEDAQTYEVSARAIRPCRMFVLDATCLGEFMRTEFPMACHFLVGQSVGRFRQSRILGPHDRLIQLGQLTAGLTHELNNPAAAAVRATAELRSRIASLRHKLSLLADGSIDREAMSDLVQISDEVAELITKSHDLTPLQKSDREDEIGAWLQQRGIDRAWQLAPTYAEAGLDTDHLEQIVATLAHHPGADASAVLRGAVEWLTCTIEAELLMAEITDATTRVSDLVEQTKQYTQLDRAPFDYADVHGLLSTTVGMLAHRLGTDIAVVTDFDATLPPLPCWPAELNQVWTNLIDNAATAMRGGGTLTLRTLHQGDMARVEVCDDGPGVPDDLRERIFDPFFTTKPIGEGVGLGLDLAARVVDKHGGSLWVESAPGDTRFITVLPLTLPFSDTDTAI